MNDENRAMKWAFVVTLVVLAIVILYPPSKTLKPGIDLAGGISLLYEIDVTGLEKGEIDNLSERMMAILKDRVDPTGQMNIEWRPVGNTRLEIRMPFPSKEAKERRDTWNAVQTRLTTMNVGRFEVERALQE
ncbi:MAG: hypothetical protein IID36_08870, partial [Planctomycetes bacterium]|nr:hypothetical protein [Planctomycetota bacterium]